MGESVRRNIVRRSVVWRSPADLLLAAEALLLLAFFRACLMFLPVRRIVQAIARGPAPAIDAVQDAAVAQRVRWAVEAAARNSPIAFVCFPQALAGYAMLRRRGVQGTMVYGVARSPEGKLAAHTWLLVGERILLGAEGAAAFTPVQRWGHDGPAENTAYNGGEQR